MATTSVYIEPTITKDGELSEILLELFPNHRIVKDNEIDADCIITHHSLFSKYKNTSVLTLTPLFLRQTKEKGVKLSELDHNWKIFRNLHLYNKNIYVSKKLMDDFSGPIDEIRKMGGTIINSKKPEADFRLLKRYNSKEGGITSEYVESLYNHQTFIDPVQFFSTKPKGSTKKLTNLKKNQHIPYTQTITHSFTATKGNSQSTTTHEKPKPTFSQNNRPVVPPSQTASQLIDESSLSSPKILDEDSEKSFSPSKQMIYSRPYIIDSSSQKSSVELYVSAFSKSTRELFENNQTNGNPDPPKLLSIGPVRHVHKRLEPETIDELMQSLAKNVKKQKCI